MHLSVNDITKQFCTLWEKIRLKVTRFKNFRNPENFNNQKKYLKIVEKSSFSLETNVAWFLTFHENIKKEVLNYFNWNVYKTIHLCFLKQKLVFLSFVSLSLALNNFEWSIFLYLPNSREFSHDILLESDLSKCTSFATKNFKYLYRRSQVGALKSGGNVVQNKKLIWEINLYPIMKLHNNDRRVFYRLVCIVMSGVNISECTRDIAPNLHQW